MEITGTIKVLSETKEYGAKGFRKRELVITTEEQYPQTISIEFVQDKTDLLDNFQVGQNVKIGINLGGREWVNPQGETKYFNSIKGWRIDLEASVEPYDNKPTLESNEAEDDLPF